MAELEFAHNPGNLGNIPGKTIHFQSSSWKYYTTSQFAKEMCCLVASPSETSVHSLAATILRKFLCNVASQNAKHAWLQEPFRPDRLRTPSNGVGSGLDHVYSTNKLLWSLFGTEPRPPPLKGLGAVVLVRTRVQNVFTPAQTNHSKGGKWKHLTGLKSAGVKAHLNTLLGYIYKYQKQGIPFVTSSFLSVSWLLTTSDSFRLYSWQKWLFCKYVKSWFVVPWS